MAEPELWDSLYAVAINVATGIAGAAAAVFALRRKFSADTTGIAHDKAERDLMATLLAERDLMTKQLREAWAQRITDAEQIARCGALQEAAHRDLERLRDELFHMRIHTRKLTSIIVKLDPDTAHLLELDTKPGDGIDMDDRRGKGAAK